MITMNLFIQVFSVAFYINSKGQLMCEIKEEKNDIKLNKQIKK